MEGEGGGVALWFLATVLWRVACGPRPWPPLMARGVAPRIRPCCMLGQGCLAAPGAGRGLAGRWWVILAGGGGGGRCAAPPQKLGRGPRGAGGGKVALLRSFSPPSPAGHQGGSLRHHPAIHTALVRVRPSCRGPRDAIARRHSAAGLLRVLREWACGWREACGVQQRVPRQWHPSLGVAGISAGVSPPLAWLSVARGGRRGGGEGGGGSPLSLSGPLVLLPGRCGGAARWPRLPGASR